MIKATIRTMLLSAAFAAANIASAGIVTFDNFSTGAFSSGTEDGFTIVGTHTSEYTGFGNPAKSLGVSAANTVASVTFSNGGFFTFESLDLNRAISNPLTQDVTVSGYLNGSLLATDTLSVSIPSATLTNYVAFHLAGVTLDSMVISMSSTATNSPLIDNVTFGDAAPEPGTLLLFGAGLVSCILVRKRVRGQ